MHLAGGNYTGPEVELQEKHKDNTKSARDFMLLSTQRRPPFKELSPSKLLSKENE
jgi:hypothetical protein